MILTVLVVRRAGLHLWRRYEYLAILPCGDPIDGISRTPHEGRELAVLSARVHTLRCTNPACRAVVADA